MKKRSVKIQGHATSISLEDEFWEELRRIAADEKIPMSGLIAEIDRKRGRHNLSSALRLHVLAKLRGKLQENSGSPETTPPAHP